MIVFKNYFRIVKKHLGVIIMFASIAIGISVANTSYSTTNDYVNVEPKLAIINYDNSLLIDNFIEYIEKSSSIIDIENDEKTIQDALYLNKVDSILIIPKNFTSKLFNGEDVKVDIKKSTQNISLTTELLVNRFFKEVDSYLKAGMNENEIINTINNNKKTEVKVEMLDKNNSEMNKLVVYYSFENYSFLSIFIFVVGTIMCIFNKDMIKKRNYISSLKSKSFSNQLFLGHIVLTLSVWAIFVLISFVLYGSLMVSGNGLLLIINSFCFAFTATSIAYLIGSLVKNENVISGIQNTVGLGLSFISGCFVPIELLDVNIISFAKLFPSYWFINGNYNIVKLTTFDFETLKPIFNDFILIIIFGIVYFSVAKIITSKKTM